MASGETTTSALADSLETSISAARLIREQVGVMPQLCDKVTLGTGIGLTWSEVAYAALTAQSVGETDRLENPQELSDSIISITPTVVGILTVITDRVRARITPKGFAKIGDLGQNAMQRKKDQDGLVVLDGATTSLCGAGSTLTIGHVSAASTQITSNATEVGIPPIRCVLHGFQINDIADEIKAGIGTYPLPEGISARVLSEGFKGMITGAQIFEDGNITIDSSSDAKGGVFAKDGIVLVQGIAPRMVAVRDEALGGGANKVYHYDEYAYGERSAGHWLFEIYSDATAPTS